MNGARSTFKRKGYLLTALAAAVLLAASPGTATAQNTTGITITGPAQNTIGDEGGTATYTVTVRGYIPVTPAANDTNGDGIIQPTETATNPAAFAVNLANPAAATGTTTVSAGENEDLNPGLHVLAANFDPPANPSLTRPLLFSQSQNISVVTVNDRDAEDEGFTLAFSLSATTGLTVGEDATSAAIALADSTGYASPCDIQPGCAHHRRRRNAELHSDPDAGPGGTEGRDSLHGRSQGVARPCESHREFECAHRQAGAGLDPRRRRRGCSRHFYNPRCSQPNEVDHHHAGRWRSEPSYRHCHRVGAFGSDRRFSGEGLAVDRCCGHQRAAGGHGDGGR